MKAIFQNLSVMLATIAEPKVVHLIDKSNAVALTKENAPFCGSKGTAFAKAIPK